MSQRSFHGALAISLVLSSCRPAAPPPAAVGGAASPTAAKSQPAAPLRRNDLLPAASAPSALPLLAYVSTVLDQPDSPVRLMLRDFATGTDRQLAVPGKVQDYAWLRDGSGLVVVNEEGRLYRVDLPGRDAKPLVDDPRSIGAADGELPIQTLAIHPTEPVIYWAAWLQDDPRQPGWRLRTGRLGLDGAGGQRTGQFEVEGDSQVKPVAEELRFEPGGKSLLLSTPPTHARPFVTISRLTTAGAIEFRLRPALREPAPGEEGEPPICLPAWSRDARWRALTRQEEGQYLVEVQQVASRAIWSTRWPYGAQRFDQRVQSVDLADGTRYLAACFYFDDMDKLVSGLRVEVRDWSTDQLVVSLPDAARPRWRPRRGA